MGQFGLLWCDGSASFINFWKSLELNIRTYDNGEAGFLHGGEFGFLWCDGSASFINLWNSLELIIKSWKPSMAMRKKWHCHVLHSKLFSLKLQGA